MNLSTKGWSRKGRFYNESEANSGANVIVLGSEIASLPVEPIGKT
jgi:putative ABC transport system permease protein